MQMQAVAPVPAAHSTIRESSISVLAAETLISVRALLVILILCCGLYPLSVYALGQVLYPWQANGSLVDARGNRATPQTAAASALLGQAFSSPRYFHPRPSAAGAGYDGANSGGTNLGPISDKLLNGVADDPSTKDVDESFPGVKQLVDAYRRENGLAPDALVPADAVTRSGSGLDPHISLQNALLQMPRVARERGVAEAVVRAAVDLSVDRRFLGVLGEDGVNVARLNASLDESAPSP